MAVEIRPTLGRLTRLFGGDDADAIRKKLPKAWAARKKAQQACLAHAQGGASRQGADGKKHRRLLDSYLRADNAVSKLEDKLYACSRTMVRDRGFSWSGLDEIEALFGQPRPPPGSRRPQPDRPPLAPAPSRRAAPPPPRAVSPATALRQALGSEPGATYASREAGVGGADLAALRAIARDPMAAARRQPELAGVLLAATASDSQIRRVRFALHPDQINRSPTLAASSRAGHLEKAGVVRDIFESAVANRATLADIASADRPASQEASPTF